LLCLINSVVVCFASQNFEESDEDEDIEETAAELIEKYERIEGSIVSLYLLDI
jgi:hypothetical protein